jgi:enoyl-CoA hydratase/carnithine racemase
VINLSKEEGIYILTMNHSGSTICLDWQDQMVLALNEMEANAIQGTALVMTGEGKFFNNGVNLEAMKKFDDAQMKKFSHTMLEIHRRMVMLPFPSVAAINGHAFAGGAFLAMSLDYRIMREDRGWICISEVDAGVPIPAPMMDILHAKLPAFTVRDAALTGKRYTADEAIAAGMVDTKASSETLLRSALELAKTLASKEPGIFKEIKQTLYGKLAKKLVY